MSFNRLQSLQTKYLNAHIADEVAHITAAERTAWNAKAAGDHTHSSLKNGEFLLSAPTLTANSTISIEGHKHVLADITDFAKVFTWKGNCTKAELLAKTGMVSGDVWCVTDENYLEYAYTTDGTARWEPLGSNAAINLTGSAATDGHFAMFADAHGNVSDDSYVPYTTYSASGDSEVKVVTEAALKGGLATKMALVDTAKAGEVVQVSSTGDAEASGFKVGATDKTSFGANNELAVESAVKDWVESIVPVVPEVIGKMDKVTTFTAGHIVTLVADSQATPQGNATDSGFSIGGTDKTDFGSATEIAVEAAVKDYADTEIAKKMALVGTGKDDQFIVATSTGDAAASGYTLGVTVAAGFGSANKLATEAGAKAYADSIKPDISTKMNFAAAADVNKVLIVKNDGDATASSFTIGATDTTDFGSTSELAVESAAKGYTDARESAVKAIIGGSYSSSSTVADAISANAGNITANTNAITKLNGDATTEGSVAKAVKDGDDAVKAIIGGSYSSSSTVASAISANTSAITTLNGSDTTAGSVAKQVKDGDDAVKAIIGGSYSSSDTVAAAISANTGNITTNTNAIATLNGDASTAGSVAKAVKDGDDAVKAIIGGSYSSSSTVATAIDGKANKKQHTAQLAGTAVAAADLEAALVSGGMQHQIVCSAAATINLPTTAATFADRSANVDVIINAGSYNVIITDGTQSETFAADSDKNMIYQFKTVKTGAETFAWRLFE